MNSTDTSPVSFVDTTLRDGEQTPGVAFSIAEKERIARALSSAGIDEIEAGTPAMGGDEAAWLRHLVSLDLPCRITAWCRACEADLDAALTCGMEGVHFSFPLSDLHLTTFGKNRDWLWKRLENLILLAEKRFPYISVGAQDASRADPEFLAAFARRCGEMGIHRIRIADTVGIWNPSAVSEAIRNLRAVTSCIIGFHGHNDLGMATANTLAAIEGGAGAVDVTINGLGERAGNAPLEEVVMALEVAMGRDSGIDTTHLMALSQLVADISERPIPPGKPVVGGNAFTHESGIHCRALLRESRTYEPFTPELAGRNGRSFMIGKHSGRALLRHVLDLEDNQDEGLSALLAAVRGRALQCRGGIDIREVRRMWAHLSSDRKTA